MTNFTFTVNNIRNKHSHRKETVNYTLYTGWFIYLNRLKRLASILVQKSETFLMEHPVYFMIPKIYSVLTFSWAVFEEWQCKNYNFTVFLLHIIIWRHDDVIY